jgi:hypothetical protein
MKIKLHSRIESLSGEPIIAIYRKLGFEVDDNGFFTNGHRDLEIDTERDEQYQGMSRRHLMMYLKEKIGCPIVAGGSNWDILNDR